MSDATHPILSEADGQAIPVHPLAEGEVEAFLSTLGVKVTPVAESHLCCGSAGTVARMGAGFWAAVFIHSQTSAMRLSVTSSG